MATSIITLHSIVPHVHLGERTSMTFDSNFERKSSFLLFVQNMFLLDQGEGHVENYEISSGDLEIELNSNFCLLDNLMKIASYDYIEILDEKQNLYQNSDPPPDVICTTYLDRGPPNLLKA